MRIFKVNGFELPWPEDGIKVEFICDQIETIGASSIVVDHQIRVKNDKGIGLIISNKNGQEGPAFHLEGDMTARGCKQCGTTNAPLYVGGYCYDCHKKGQGHAIIDPKDSRNGG